MEHVGDMPRVEPTGKTASTNGHDKMLARINALMQYPDAIAAAEAVVAKANEEAAEELEFSSLADVKEKMGKTRWLWKPYIPCGYPTLICARSGVGKSGVAMHIVKHLLSGKAFPDGTECPKGDYVIWCDTEARQQLNMERADAWGIPLDRVLMPFKNPLRQIRIDQEEDLQQLIKLIKAKKPIAVIVDSLSGAHRQKDEADLLNIMSRLAEIARDFFLPMLVIHHLRKPSPLEQGVGESEVELDDIRGSSVIGQFSPVILGCHRPDPDHIEKVRMHFVKVNLTKMGPPLGYEWTEDGGITWCDPPIIKKSGSEEKKDKATEFLMTLLYGGPRLSKEVFEEAEKAGIQENTLRVTAKRIGVEMVKRKSDGKWEWSLPIAVIEDDDIAD